LLGYYTIEQGDQRPVKLLRFVNKTINARHMTIYKAHLKSNNQLQAIKIMNP